MHQATERRDAAVRTHGSAIEFGQSAHPRKWQSRKPLGRPLNSDQWPPLTRGSFNIKFCTIIPEFYVQLKMTVLKQSLISTGRLRATEFSDYRSIDPSIHQFIASSLHRRFDCFVRSNKGVILSTYLYEIISINIFLPVKSLRPALISSDTTLLASE